MSLTSAGITIALNALTLTTMGMHTSDPTDDGSSGEASGNGYARKACTYDNSASGSDRDLNGNVLFDLGAGIYTHFSLWNGATCIDNGALNSPKELTETGQINIAIGDVSIT